MNNSIHVFIYLTGVGWRILKEHDFLDKYCQYRFPVESQLGCSHAVLSTTLTGELPNKHGYFSSYYLKKSNTIFEIIKRLKNRIICKDSGYLGRNSVPIRNLNYFLQANHHEKILTPGYFAPLASIIDLVHEKKLTNYIVGGTPNSSIQALKNLCGRLKSEAVDFSFIQIDEMDELLHHYPNDLKKINKKLGNYERQIKKIISLGNLKSSEFTLTVFSGHGMTLAPQVINIKKKIDSLEVNYGYDYYAVYDPTMARFWYMDKSAKAIILDKLSELRHCQVLTNNDKIKLGIDFPDQRYGETIALVEPGFQIFPNDLLSKPLAGMHGYSPDHPDSLGACISTQPISPPPRHVKDFFNIMSSFVK